MITFEQDEKVVKVVRRHFLVLFPMFMGVLFAAFFPLILYFFITSNIIPWDQALKEWIQNFFAEWRVFAYSLWLLMLWVLFFVEWTDYYLDMWVITNKRIIDIEQKGFFHRDVTSFRYKDIQDTTVETKGFIETFFKFGTLHIQTSGHNRQILIKDAYHPEEAKSLILSMQEKVS